MADNFVTNPAAGGDTFAADDIAGVKWQRVKLGQGVDGSATDVSSASPLPVDTELPAAAALSDSTANPTAPMVGAAGMVYDQAATTWRRAAQPRASWDTQPYTGVTATMSMLVQDGTILRPPFHSNGISDGEAGTNHGAASPRLWNGATYDRQRGNTEGTLLASAARTTAALSAAQTNHNARGVNITLTVTARAAATTMQLYVCSAEPVGGNLYAFGSGLATAVPAGPNILLLTVYPGAVGTGIGFSAAGHDSVQQPLPRTWYVYAVPSDANSVTYSVGYQLIL